MLQNILSQFRKQYGDVATYNDHSYAIVTQSVPPVRAGLEMLHGMLAPLAIAADPRVFNFTYSDFAANSDSYPVYNSTIIYHDNTYVVTRVEVEEVGAGNPISLRAFGYRQLNATDSEVLLDSAFTLWTPLTAIAQLDSTNYNVKDVGFTNSGTIKCMLEPMTHAEKMGIFGRVDIRGNQCYTPTTVPLGSILRNQDTGECWFAICPSELYPATSLNCVTLKHLSIPPSSITS